MIPIWVIVVLVVFGVMVFLFKTMGQVYILSLIRDKFFYAFVILILVFVAFSFTRLYSIHNLDLTTYDGVVYAFKVYGVWVKNVFANIGDITGYAVKQDWITNSTSGIK